MGLLTLLSRRPSPGSMPRLREHAIGTHRKVASKKIRSSYGPTNPTKPTARSECLYTMAM